VPVPLLKLVVNNVRNHQDDSPETRAAGPGVKDPGVGDSRVEDSDSLRRPGEREECRETDRCPRCGGSVHFTQDAEGDLSCPKCRAEVAYDVKHDAWVAYDPSAPQVASNSSLLPRSVFVRCRPCLYVSCPHNNYLNIHASTGTIKLTHPHREPWDVVPDDSCSLDVADRGPQTLEKVGDIMGLTRERTRQIEQAAVIRLRHTLAKHNSKLESELSLNKLRELIRESFTPHHWPYTSRLPYRRYNR
jgi:ribosomal protein S27AE